MQTERVKIGTRGSPLALAQAEETRSRLMDAHGLAIGDFEIVVIQTSGDRILDRPLADAGGKGLFTKEIEQALIDGRIDLAVHSSKDMPTRLPDGLELSAFLPREDVRDAFIGDTAPTVDALPQGATVGSSSLRRQALLRRMRPDISVVTFRGNVQSRLRKLAERNVDATMLAMAGLKRLGMAHVATETLDIDRFPPAPGQGAICIETRIGDDATRRLVDAVADAETAVALTCERAFLAALDGSCRTPIAGYARIEAGRIDFRGMILTPDGTLSHEVGATGRAEEAARLGNGAGLEVRERAGTRFFDGWS